MRIPWGWREKIYGEDTVRHGVHKSVYFTPDGEERHRGDALRWDNGPDLMDDHPSPRDYEEIEKFRAEHEIDNPKPGPPEKRPHWFKTHVLHEKAGPVQGKDLVKLQDSLLERDKKIRDDKYPEEMSHHTINQIEGERKNGGLAPNAGGKLLDNDEIWELENCQRQRRRGRFGGEWAEKYGPWVEADRRLPLREWMVGDYMSDSEEVGGRRVR
ncbi:MAG: hypothetical protein L6R40_001415 [Gallowayella cf. fulva]|nr:MAG: hypothetical protein L6R40_001415 [Xanthomendoza cf. fulva]